jgi:hypothetical protein
MRKRHIPPLILFILLASLTPPSFGQDQAPASVSGVLMNASTNAPLPGVLIMMTGGGVAIQRRPPGNVDNTSAEDRNGAGDS